MKVIRFETNPIVHSSMPGIEGDRGENINGPSLIRVPDWLPNPLGRYYLYFSSHVGKYIRLAYADELAGPWSIHEPGTLHIDQTPCVGHIASPDVHVIDGEKRLRMYYHGMVPEPWRTEIYPQLSFVAHSEDAIHFEALPEPLGVFYFRVFKYDGWHYAVAKHVNDDSIIYRSKDGLKDFEAGPSILPGSRHTAVQVDGDTLRLFYSVVRESPERIHVADIDLARDWPEWIVENPRDLLRPETDYEGADLPLEPSSYGRAHGPVNQLRDPGIYQEDGRTYLLYSVAGESGIAIAELAGQERLPGEQRS